MKTIKNLLLIMMLVSSWSSAFAVPTISPGTVHILGRADDREANCYVNGADHNCGPQFRFLADGFPLPLPSDTFLSNVSTEASFDDNTVTAVTAQFSITTSIRRPTTAVASLIYVFEVAPASEGQEQIVPAQVSILFDARSSIGGIGGFSAGYDLSLEISRGDELPIAATVLTASSEISAFDVGIPPTIPSLFSSNFEPDQNASVSFLAKRGNLYKIRVTATAHLTGMATQIKPRAIIKANIRQLAVTIDDTSETLLSEQIQDVLDSIEDLDLRLSQHDEDVKIELERLHIGQQRIIQLLLTPHGLRNKGNK